MNERIALLITRSVGTMWCAYAFAALALVSLPEAIAGGTAPLVAWIAQTFLQLTLLPLIMVGQSLEGRAAEQRAKEDHAALMEILEDIRSGSVCHVRKSVTT